MIINIPEERILAEKRNYVANGDSAKDALPRNEFDSFDTIDACLFGSDMLEDMTTRPPTQHMIERWTRRAIECTTFNPDIKPPTKKQLREEQRQTAIRTICLIADKCKELGITL